MTEVKLGLWLLNIDKRGDKHFVVCRRCGIVIMNLQIRANETGGFYCSNECAEEDCN